MPGRRQPGDPGTEQLEIVIEVLPEADPRVQAHPGRRDAGVGSAGGTPEEE